MNDEANDSGANQPRKHGKAEVAALALPATILAPFVVFYRALRGIWADPSSRGILITAAVLLLAGTILFMIIEGYSVLDSLYFCFITLSTIGYGDFSPSTDLGKIVTIVYGIAGLGVIAALVSAIATQRLRSSHASGHTDERPSSPRR